MDSSTTIEFPRQRDGVDMRAVGDETVLVDRATGRQHAVNATAQALWELCDGETSIEEMVVAILELFAVDQGVVEEDVRRALSQLADLDLVRWG